LLGDPSISILEGVILPWGEPSGHLRKILLPALARQFKFDLNSPWGALPKSVQTALIHGDTLAKGETKWEGVLSNIERRYNESESDTVRMELEGFMIVVPCDACSGRRLKPEVLAVTIHDRNIGEVVELAITESL